MMRFRALSRAYSALGWVQALLTFLSALIAASLKADPVAIAARIGWFPSEVVSTAQSSAWWLVPALLFLIPILQLIRRGLGNPKRWAVVQYVLDELRDKIFATVEDQRHHHRVTLFKRVTWCLCFRRWPFSGWLIPVARSGHTTQRSSALFLAPDDAERAEGVAGQTWSRNRPFYVDNLPDLTNTTSETDLVAYSKGTWMSIDSVRDGHYRARSYFGLPVEVNGEPWGVVVVDSRHPTLRKRSVKRQFTAVAGFLGKVLQGV
jgi:hypothetical protein